MENASKALLMAASVLLGLMIISLGVVLFNIFSKYSIDAQEEIQNNQISEFNNQFLKYVSYIDSKMSKEEKKEKQILLTAHDVVTIANLAKENNKNYELGDNENYSESSNYIRIDVPGYESFEKKDIKSYTKFIENNDIISGTPEKKYFVCSIENVIISKVTKKVIYMKITLT